MRCRYLIWLFTFACEPTNENDLSISLKHLCDESHSDKRSEFIINCAKAANPMSDEEGEDLVLQCEETSKRVICPIFHEIHARSGDSWRSFGFCEFIKTEPSFWKKACENFGVRNLNDGQKQAPQEDSSSQMHKRLLQRLE